ncbi:MAG: hypothetical protein QM756_32850 [Polyangiaceae bacterium]
MLDDIDKRFENILSEPPPGGGSGAAPAGRDLSTDELQEAQRLFLEISANHLGPVRDLIVEIELGDPTRDWLSVCRPAVASLRRAALDMAMNELGADSQRAALRHRAGRTQPGQHARRANEGWAEGRLRQAVLGAAGGLRGQPSAQPA